jgi:tRNA (guanine37-N1)-methyltransferase
MHYAKVQKEHAEKLRCALAKNGVLANNTDALHSDSYVLFPVTIATATIKKLIRQNGGTLIDKKGKKPDVRKRELDRHRSIARGYDVLGNIAIIEADDPSSTSAKRYASEIMLSSKRITTVLAKAGPVSGRYRIRKLRHIAGKRTYIADMTENGCRFVFDVRKTFFSVRLSFERQRISSLSKGKENVMVLFAGVGPFAIELAKKNPNAAIVAVELNKNAYEMMKKNIMLNKVGNVAPVCGDAGKVAKNYKNFADRVIMPLPKDSHSFIRQAASMSKRNGKIHIYMFVGKESPAKEGIKKLRKELGGAGKLRLQGWRKVRDYSHSEIEIVMDLYLHKV